jgi:hypothetical protein
MKTININENFATGQTLANRCFQSCKKLVSRIERAKNHILNEFHATRKSQENLFKQAVSEAEALAWQTDYPHLFFPALAVEKIQRVAAWQTRQQSLHRHHSVFAEAA